MGDSAKRLSGGNPGSKEASGHAIGHSKIFTPEVIDDIHVKSALGRYRCAASPCSSRSRTGTS
jgi:hypothetical protein